MYIPCAVLKNAIILSDLYIINTYIHIHTHTYSVENAIILSDPDEAEEEGDEEINKPFTMDEVAELRSDQLKQEQEALALEDDDDEASD